MKRGERVNVYWMNSAGGILVDAGWNTEESFQDLVSACPHPPRYVLVTHLHPDHAGAIGRIAAWSSAEIYVPEEDRGLAEFPLPPNRRHYPGEEPLRFGLVTIHVLHTPGHTPGHRCFLIDPPGALATGDMVLGEGTTWVGPPHGNMAHYMASLERLRQAGHKLLLPGHGPIQTDPIAKIDEFLNHRRQREQQVIQALAEGISTPEAIVERNYKDTPAYLHSLAALVVRAHLDKLIQEGRVSTHDGHHFTLRH